MLRANDNGNVYGFIGEGGHLDFHNIPENFGEVVLKVSCDNGFENWICLEFFCNTSPIYFSEGNCY